MAFRRFGSYQATIRTPEAPDGYSAIQVTIAQDQAVLVTKEKTDLTIDGDTVVLNLTQQETAGFRPTGVSHMGRTPGGPAYLQIRCYKAATDAPASRIWALHVYDSNSEEVLS